MRSVAAISLAVLVSCGSTSAPKPRPDQRLRITMTGEMFSASNGYTFVVAPDPLARVVRVDVRYPVGSAADPAGKEGLAHLVEHLLFEAPVVRDDGTFTVTSLLGRAALTWNASTTDAYTHYESEALPDAMDELLRIEAERAIVGCKGIDQSVFEREREVVLNELRQRAAGTDTYRLLREAFYPPDHPYHRVDTEQTVSRLTLTDACRFYESNYRASRPVVVVSGKVDPEQARASIVDYFGRVVQRPQRDSPPVSRPKLAGRIKREADVDEPLLLLGWPLPKKGSDDWYVSLFAREAIESRLRAFASVYEWGRAISTTTFGGDEAPYFVIAIALRDQDEVDEAIDAAERSVDFAFRSRTWGEERLSSTWRSKVEAQTRRFLLAYEDLGGRAKLYAQFAASGNPARMVTLLSELRASDPDKYRERARSFFEADKMRAVLLVPGGGRRKYARTTEVFDNVHRSRSYVEVDPEEADRPIALKSDLGLRLDINRFTLPSGLRVVLWPYGEQPVVHGILLQHAGAAHAPERLDGLPTLAGFDDVRDNSMSYYYTALSPNADRVMRALRRRAGARYRLSKAARERIERMLRRTRNKGIRDFDRAFRAMLFGHNHRFARPPLSVESLAAITRRSVEDWSKRFISATNGTLIIAGYFDDDLLQSLAEASSEKQQGSRWRPIEMGPLRSSPAWVSGTRDQSRPTVGVRLAFPVHGSMDEGYGARLVLEGIISARLGRLREELAVTYGLSADFVPKAGGGYWMLSGEVDSKRVDQAISALYDTLGSLYRGPDELRADFVLARRKALASLLASSSDAGSVAVRLEFMSRFGLDDDFWSRTARRIATLTPTDIQKLIESDLVLQRQVLGLIGDEAPVARGLELGKKGLARISAVRKARKARKAKPAGGAMPAGERERERERESEGEGEGERESEGESEGESESESEDEGEGEGEGEDDGTSWQPPSDSESGLVDPF